MRYDPPPGSQPGAAASGSLRTTFVREAIVQYRGRGLKAHSPLREPFQAVSLARKLVQDEAREHFVALYLDGRHRPIAHSIVSVGTATASLVHPREVFQTAVLTGAAALLVLHNHPSGDPEPSREDHQVAERLVKAGNVLGISLLDSIVWTHAGRAFVSFREREPGLFAPGP